MALRTYRTSLRVDLVRATLAVLTAACGSERSGALGESFSAGSASGAPGSSANVEGGASTAGRMSGAGGEGGAASLLADLSASPLALTPAFAPGVHDYYVRCAAGINTLTVAATAAPGAGVRLQQPSTTDVGPSVLETFDLAEGDAAVVVASDGATSAEYWVRCLPHDFPWISVTYPSGTGPSTPGYYLIGNVVIGAAEGPYAMVVDARGTPVWYRRAPASAGALDVEALVPGTISFTPSIAYTFDASAAGEYQIDQLDPWQVSYAATAGVPLDVHELQILPNGDRMMISDVIRTGIDLTGLATFGPDSAVVDCTLQEVDPSGNLVWQWNALDHFDPVKASTWPQTQAVEGRTAVDTFHCNSIDVAPNGDLLVSSRHMDSVFYVSRQTSQVVWKLGGAASCRDAAQYLTVTGDSETSFYRQHDARFQPGGAISLFDDHTGMPGVARALIYNLDMTQGIATIAWQYLGTMASSAMGSFRPAAEGGGIIGWGAGNTQAFSEVDATGNVLLELRFAAPDTSYRAIKVPLDAFDIGVLRATTGASAATDGGT